MCTLCTTFQHRMPAHLSPLGDQPEALTSILAALGVITEELFTVTGSEIVSSQLKSIHHRWGGHISRKPKLVLGWGRLFRSRWETNWLFETHVLRGMQSVYFTCRPIRLQSDGIFVNWQNAVILYISMEWSVDLDPFPVFWDYCSFPAQFPLFLLVCQCLINALKIQGRLELQKTLEVRLKMSWVMSHHYQTHTSCWRRHKAKGKS